MTTPLILEAATAMLVALEALGSNFVVQEPRTIAACAPSPAEISVVAFLPLLHRLPHNGHSRMQGHCRMLPEDPGNWLCKLQH